MKKERKVKWSWKAVGGVIAGLWVAAIGGGYAFRSHLALWWITPSHAFEQGKKPPAPLYSRPEAWAAYPGQASWATLSTADEPRPLAEPKADVFYVHPTTYLSGASWNGPIDDPQAKRRVDQSVMKYQASLFHASCRIFAPRYRQAAIAFASAGKRGGWQAMDLAFQDVQRAFEHFLRKNGERPFFVAGHSQGAMHALRLLETFPDPEVASHPSQGVNAASHPSQGVNATSHPSQGVNAASHPSQGVKAASHPSQGVNAASHPSQGVKGSGLGGWKKRLVAAYIVGTSVPMRKFETTLRWLKPCSSARQIRCIATWTTLGEEGDPSLWDRLPVFSSEGYKPADARGRLCVNPLSWGQGSEVVAARHHRGGLGYAPGKEMKPLEKGLVSARCKDGSLIVSEPPPHFRRLGFRKADYHVYDYSLFYQDVRLNVLERLEAFLAN